MDQANPPAAPYCHFPAGYPGSGLLVIVTWRRVADVGRPESRMWTSWMPFGTGTGDRPTRSRPSCPSHVIVTGTDPEGADEPAPPGIVTSCTSASGIDLGGLLPTTSLPSR